jgi:hypothetical protein
MFQHVGACTTEYEFAQAGLPVAPHGPPEPAPIGSLIQRQTRTAVELSATTGAVWLPRSNLARPTSAMRSHHDKIAAFRYRRLTMDEALGGSFNPGPQSTRFRGWPLHRDDVGSLNKQRSRYRSRALADEARAHAVQRQQITLLWGLSGNKVHGRSLHGLRDRLDIAIVVSCVLEECLAHAICQAMCCEPQPASRPARQRCTLASRRSSGMT